MPNVAAAAGDGVSLARRRFCAPECADEAMSKSSTAEVILFAIFLTAIIHDKLVRLRKAPALPALHNFTLISSVDKGP